MRDIRPHAVASWHSVVFRGVRRLYLRPDPAADLRVTGFELGAPRFDHANSEANMVLLEMSIVPLGQGESVSQYVARCVDLVDQSGLDYELHAMGTIVEGELGQVLQLMQQCIEEVAKLSSRVSCTAKIDYRQGVAGGLKSKVASVEHKLGRSVRR